MEALTFRAYIYTVRLKHGSWHVWAPMVTSGSGYATRHFFSFYYLSILQNVSFFSCQLSLYPIDEFCVVFSFYSEFVIESKDSKVQSAMYRDSATPFITCHRICVENVCLFVVLLWSVEQAPYTLIS